MKAFDAFAAAIGALLGWIVLVIFLAATVLLIATSLMPSRAEAQARCIPHAAAIEQLADKHGEQLLFSGVAANGHRLELFVNPDGTTWTAVVIPGEGVACPLASGTGWAATSPGALAAPGTEG